LSSSPRVICPVFTLTEPSALIEMARAAEPACNAREVHLRPLKRRDPGDAAAKVRALPVESEQTARTTDTEDVTLRPLEVHEPELAVGIADGIGAGWRHAVGGHRDDPTKAGGVPKIEEVQEGGPHGADEEQKAGEGRCAHEGAARDLAGFPLACTFDAPRR